MWKKIRGIRLARKSNKSDETNKLEEIEDEALVNLEKRKKARLRTRGPYRKTSTNNLPDNGSNR
jgi:hypothetical protein